MHARPCPAFKIQARGPVLVHEKPLPSELSPQPLPASLKLSESEWMARKPRESFHPCFPGTVIMDTPLHLCVCVSSRVGIQLFTRCVTSSPHVNFSTKPALSLSGEPLFSEEWCLATAPLTALQHIPKALCLHPAVISLP